MFDRLLRAFTRTDVGTDGRCDFIEPRKSVPSEKFERSNLRIDYSFKRTRFGLLASFIAWDADRNFLI